jgi:mannose-6-phosphate isomerase-like protein (cupin superfamily)
MANITDISVINSNTGESRPFESGTEMTLCSPALCGSENLTVYKRTIVEGKQFNLEAGNNYHLVYLMRTPAKGFIHFKDKTHLAEEGAGVLLVPSESARFESAQSNMDLLQLVVPKPPAAVEDGLAGGPGYFFNRKVLRALTDASGGRVRRFCAESSVRLRDGNRLTPTNAIQAGEMHYNEGGSSPYHMHRGTPANPKGAAHCYMTFKGRGVVEVENEFQEIDPGTLVYFPPGVPHRLRSHGGPLDYFEIQAWRSFKTTILSEETQGLKWYYERESPDAELVEWNQS